MEDTPSLVFPALNQSLPRGWPRSITPPGHPAATACFERQLQGGSDASEGSSQGHYRLNPKSVTAPEPQTPWKEPFQSIPVPLGQDGYSQKEDLVCVTRDCTPLSTVNSVTLGHHDAPQVVQEMDIVGSLSFPVSR